MVGCERPWQAKKPMPLLMVTTEPDAILPDHLRLCAAVASGELQNKARGDPVPGNSQGATLLGARGEAEINTGKFSRQGANRRQPMILMLCRILVATRN